jgi:hypothetical protein
LFEDGERAEADDGFVGDDPMLLKTPAGVRYMDNENARAAAALARSRHENGNRLFTKLSILDKQFTNDITDHGTIVRASAVLIQLSIQFGAMRLFDVDEMYDEINSAAYHPTTEELKEEIARYDEDEEDAEDPDYEYRSESDVSLDDMSCSS